MSDPIYTLEKYCKLTNHTTNYDFDSSNVTFNLHECKNYSNIYVDQAKDAQPNVALISVTYVIVTCYMAILLKKLRKSNFFSSYVRRTLSDVGILISIVLMVGVDFLIRFKTDIDIQVYNTIFVVRVVVIPEFKFF